MARTAGISVSFGTLAAPLEVKRVKSRTTLASFLESIGVTHDENVRVNAKQVAKSYVLRNGDIITSTESVSGGC